MARAKSAGVTVFQPKRQSSDDRATTDPPVGSKEGCLLVLELEGVLWAAPPSGIHPLSAPVPRPYLPTLIEYILQANTSCRLAIWTRLPKSLALHNIKLLGIDLFDPNLPGVLNSRVLELWGSEESGVSSEQFLGGAEQGPRDLDVVSQPWMSLSSCRTDEITALDSLEYLKDQCRPGVVSA